MTALVPFDLETSIHQSYTDISPITLRSSPEFHLNLHVGPPLVMSQDALSAALVLRRLEGPMRESLASSLWFIRAAILLAIAALFAQPGAAESLCPSSYDPITPDIAGIPGEAPANIGRLKTQLKIYHDCAYMRDFARVAKEAEAWIDERVARKSPDEKLALVLDIDETSLSNWEQIVRNDFGYIKEGTCEPKKRSTACAAGAWEAKARATALAPTLALFSHAKKKNVAIFFITGRLENPKKRAATRKNLHVAGYHGFAGLYLRTHTAGCDVRCFKTSQRKTISKTHAIIANIGDQWSDLDPHQDMRGGAYSERIFKMPNPFYFIP